MERINKLVESILTKTVKSHHRDWANRLPKELWAYQTTWRTTTGLCPYELVYGKNFVFLIEFEIKNLRKVLE